MPVWTPEHHMHIVPEEATRVSDALGLELQRIVCRQIGAEN